jgi:uncharacterized coiled-coil protein SlyX
MEGQEIQSGNTLTSEKPVSITTPAKPLATRDDVLRLIVGLKLDPILRRQHLKREVIIGLVGLRGDGKSGSGAVIALLDYMLNNNPVWSNMAIRTAIRVEDETAISMTHGVLHHGGVVTYTSQELDKEGLLRFDPSYHEGCYFIDEINMEFAEARRSMSNTNLFMDRVAQQLRKYQNSMIYTVINEMFIDARIRELTDIFIRCEDTALSVEGLNHHKQPGIDFKWTIYPMSGYLCGRENSYYLTKKPLPPVYLHFEPWRGIYDDKLAQAPGKMKYGFNLADKTGNNVGVGIETQQSSETETAVDQYKWLEKIVNKKMLIDDEGNEREFVPQSEVMNYPAIAATGWSKAELSHVMNALFSIPTIAKRVNGVMSTVYRIPLDKRLPSSDEPKQAM